MSVQLVLLALIAASVLGSLAIVLANSSRIPRAAVGLQTGTVPPVLDVAGGARFGLMNYTAPMGRLRIWTDGLEVAAIASRASLAWSDIQHAVLIQPLIPVAWVLSFRSRGRLGSPSGAREPTVSERSNSARRTASRSSDAASSGSDLASMR